MRTSRGISYLAAILIIAGVVVVVIAVVSRTASHTTYGGPSEALDPGEVVSTGEEKAKEQKKTDKESSVTHVKTPDSVKALYMTSWIAGTPSLREGILDLVRKTEINTLVIDIKDDTGRISYDVLDPELEAIGAEEIRIADLRELIEELHKEGVYVVGRISAFQDPYLVGEKPEWAVRSISTGGVWRDRKGLTWLDPSQKEVWDYLALIGVESWKAGFDELNYDYIRFPTDGNLKDIKYAVSGDRVEKEIVVETRTEEVYAEDGVTVIETKKVPTQVITGKSEIIKEFFEYLTGKLRAETDAVLSADLFGLVTIADDDLGIGQWLLYALPYFDYIAPMTYPSHYANGFEGYGNPAMYPYEVLDISMKGAINRAKKAGEPIEKIRPWLQDFDLGATYTPEMVRAQIRAVYDNGLDSWMLWDASNTYTRGALLAE